jgi:DNA-binding IclR family transcriptional regulator
LKNPYLVPGLERGLKLLQLFRPGRTELGAPQIARELDLPRSTAFRLL